ncbi:hypothetical protein BaRGS_00035063 [Batillaria attramentaria]|uniref:Uncharacterized protein n=1 Tax=Batillaria attramentaria TaxID=370345 RepID=A0ABD0JFI2_9CAEN
MQRHSSALRPFCPNDCQSPWLSCLCRRDSAGRSGLELEAETCSSQLLNLTPSTDSVTRAQSQYSLQGAPAPFCQSSFSDRVNKKSAEVFIGFPSGIAITTIAPTAAPRFTSSAVLALQLPPQTSVSLAPM